MATVITCNSDKSVKIGVYEMPYRKKPCLCVATDTEIVKYATFNNQEAADRFLCILLDFVNGKTDRIKRWNGETDGRENENDQD